MTTKHPFLTHVEQDVSPKQHVHAHEMTAGGTCVFSSEFEKDAQATYCENHGDYPFGDITKITVSDIPDHDVPVAGFPCQPFSHAGLKKGLAIRAVRYS